MTPRKKPRADLAEITAFWSEVMRNPGEDIRNRIKVSELLAKASGLEGEEPGPNPFSTLTTAQLLRLIGEDGKQE